jgi:hypothetical protein
LGLGGTGAKTTPTFAITTADWDLQWSYDCSSVPVVRRGFQAFAYTATGTLAGAVHGQAGAKGSDTERFHDGPGSFSVKVGSPCPWSINVTSP